MSATIDATVTATNSSDATQTVDAIFRSAIADSTGKIITDSLWRRMVIVPVEIPPGGKYTTSAVHTVPSPGHYEFTLPEVIGVDGHPVVVPFESVGATASGG